MKQPETVLDFWLKQVGPDGWYVASDAVDDQIRDRFGPLVTRAIAGELDGWTASPAGTLALLILLDQFPRNLHRGSADAFAGDMHARKVARRAICGNDDLQIEEPGRQFFYLPFEHSESLADQDWSVALFKARMTTLSEESMWHVEQHREMIVKFGRFPFRNAALDRQSTPEEVAFLEGGGYVPGLKAKD